MTRKLFPIILIMVLGLGIIAALPMKASAWSCAFTYSPDTVYQDQNTTFKFTLSNDGNAALDLWNVVLKFDWAPDSKITVAGSSKTTISGWHLQDFSVTVHIPRTVTAGQHIFNMSAMGKTDMDWFSSDAHWNGNPITVKQIPQLEVKISPWSSNDGNPRNITFKADISGGFPPYTYLWNFGDNQTNSSAEPTHCFEKIGNYTVTLLVTDNETHPQQVTVTYLITITNESITTDNQMIAIVCALFFIVIIMIFIARVVT